MTKLIKKPSRYHYWILCIAFSFLSLLGNYFSLPLFFGVDLIFGSVAVMLAVAILGPLAAIITALIGASYTFFLWGHPYALIIFTLEAIIVSQLYKWTRNLMIADLVYWFFLGVPLVMFCYFLIIGMNWPAVMLIAFKQSLNGLLNCLISGAVLLCLLWMASLFRLFKANKPRVEDVLFHGVVMMTFLACFIPIIYESYAHKRLQETMVEAQLERDANIMISYIEQDLSQESPEFLDFIKSRFVTDMVNVVLFSEDGRIIMQHGDEWRPEKEGRVQNITETLSIWTPENIGSTMQRWKHGYYFLEKTINRSEVASILMSYPALGVVNKLEEQSLNLFKLLSLLSVLSICLSYILARLITRPLNLIAQVAKDMPSDLVVGKRPSFSEIHLDEYDSLKGTLDIISDTLAMNFEKLNVTQDALTSEVKLRTSELDDQLRHTKAILNTVIDGIITIDDKGLIQSCNPAGLKCFGYTEDEVLGKNIKMLMPNPYQDAHDGYLKSYQETRQAKIIGIGREVQGLRSDGTIFPMELAVSEVRLKDKAFYVGMVRDITERKRIEKMKSEFISTISHELRTPLTAISGSLGLVLGGVTGTLPHELHNLLDVAHTNSKRLNLLINDLLDIEKLLAGKMAFHFSEYPLHSLLSQALKTNKAYADQYGVELELRDCDHTVMVSVDEVRFAQIMANLLSNAAKFSPRGEKVTITASIENERVRISVRDVGEGIPSSFHAQIFQKFSQADSSDSRRKGGTGLGLAITRELVERMNGAIAFDTSPAGTEFYFFLPCVSSQVSGMQE